MDQVAGGAVKCVMPGCEIEAWPDIIPVGGVKQGEMRQVPQKLAQAAAFAFGLAILGLAAFMLYQAQATFMRKQLEARADELIYRIQLQSGQHLILLAGALAFFRAFPGEIGHDAFRRYVAVIGLQDQFGGIQGIGFAKMAEPENLAGINTMLRNTYGGNTQVYPPLREARGYPIVYLEPLNDRNRAAIGYDMYTDQGARREAMDRARDTGIATATGAVKLKQEIDPDGQQGFVVYLPLYEGSADPKDVGERQARLSGFVFAPFRAGDFFRAAFGPNGDDAVYFSAYSSDPEGQKLLFTTRPPGIATNNMAVAGSEDAAIRRTLSIAGKAWLLVFEPQEATILAPGRFSLEFYLVVVLGPAFAAASAGLVHYQIRGLELTNREDEHAAHANTQREMLLQEMKHRIKNYLTRVLAISNQTARVSADLDQYSAAFNSRIHAMSASQDLLTRSPEETALLRELLVGELRSIFADRDSRYRLEGEKIRLNAQQTQSLGLTFHELATNALKYGGLAKEGNSLLVTWRSENREDEPYLVIDWIERGKTASTETPKGGFGSRLIQLSIVTELEGSFDQKFEDGGYHATITIPLRDETSD